jgi:hypothetical protein
MRPVFVHSDPTVVGLKKSLLEGAGIDCFIQNENSSANFGAGFFWAIQSPVFDPVLCIIDDSRFDEAMSLLETTPAPSVEEGADWRCPKCDETIPGNFEMCWNCSEDKPAAI